MSDNPMLAEHGEGDLVSIDFLNPTFHSGVNVTVRQGDKWARRLSIGDKLLIEGTTGTGEVIGALYCEQDEIPSGLLKHVNDPACRTRAGLRKALNEIYGAARFDHRMVTVIVFTMRWPS